MRQRQRAATYYERHAMPAPATLSAAAHATMPLYGYAPCHADAHAIAIRHVAARCLRRRHKNAVAAASAIYCAVAVCLRCFAKAAPLMRMSAGPHDTT